MSRRMLVVPVAGVLFAAGLIVATPGAGAASGDNAAKYLVVLTAGASQADSLSAAGVPATAVYARYHSALNGYAVSLSAGAAAILRSEPAVEAVRPVRQYHATDTTPIEQIPQITTRAVRRINGLLSSAVSGNNRGTVPRVNVAVIDSGIQPDQPDLRVVGGVNCSTDPGGYEDANGHGTIVAGLVGATDNAFGIVGVAPGARLWSVRVLDSNLEADDAQVLCGIDWVTSTRLDHNAGNDIAVANLSLGGPGRDDGNCGRTDGDVFHRAICRSVAAGVTYVAAAGNDGASMAHFIPAAYREVLAVTGMNDSDGAPGGLAVTDPCMSGYPDDTAAPFSNFATSPEALEHLVAAPAVCVSSTYIDSDVATDSGTSFAAPLASGVVTLCIAYRECAGLTPRKIVTKMVSDTDKYNLKHPHYGFVGDPLRPVGHKVYGFLVDASRY